LAGFEPRAVSFFRPYADEIPWELLALADPDDERGAAYADADFVRVAKLDGKVLGVYVIERQTPTRFALLNLAVEPSHRGCGLGSWLLGHAIGLAESKGAREIVVPARRSRGLFSRVGFVVAGEDLELELTPE
jgi:GNAT superfamily N-acetyltransferase